MKSQLRRGKPSVETSISRVASTTIPTPVARIAVVRNSRPRSFLDERFAPMPALAPSVFKAISTAP